MTDRENLSTSRNGARALAAVALLLTLAATLTPVGAEGSRRPAGCVFCGERWLADAVANVALFLPLGLAATVHLRRPLRALLVCALLSTAIELAQIVVPGRDPAPSDVLFNSLGALLGILALRSAHAWAAPSGRVSAALPLLAGAAAAAALLLPGYLLGPSPPPSAYYGQWTADLGHFERYRGRLSSVRLGPLELAGEELADPRTVGDMITARAALRVAGVAGPPPPALAPVFSIFDERQREILLLGADGGDLLFRVATRASRLGLDAPAIRSAGALDGLAAGAPLDLAVRGDRGRGYCIRAGPREECGLGFRGGDGWRLIHDLPGVPAPALPLLRLAWVAALLLPLGFWLRRDPYSVGALALVAATLAAGPRLGGLVPASGWEYAGAAAGLGMGLALRALAATRRFTPSPIRGTR